MTYWAGLILFFSLIFSISAVHADDFSYLLPTEEEIEEAKRIISTFQQPDIEEAKKIVSTFQKPDLPGLKPEEKKEVACDFRISSLISFSIPKDVLLNLMKEAVRINRECGREAVSLYVRGFAGDDMVETLRILSQIVREINADLPLNMDPEIFERINPVSVPFTIVERGKERTVVIGDASLSYALEASQRTPGETIRAGKTYPLREKDLRVLLAERVHRVYEAAQRRKEKGVKVAVDLNLGKVKEERVFHLDPSYTVEEDIKAPDGTVIVKKGTVIDPSEYVKLGKYVFIDGTDEKEVRFALEEKPKKIIITKGDPLELAGKYGAPFYVATREIVEFFRIERTPSVVEGDGRYIRVSERKVR
jgi:conjugal transfer pilus assembly protein TraW